MRLPHTHASRLALALAAALLAARAGGARELVRTDSRGRRVPVPVEMDSSLVNPVSEEYESAFLDRAQVAIKNNTGAGKYGNTFFENEKRSYPPAMFDVLFGDRAKGLKWLQGTDNQAGSWNRNTLGIDYYAGFTIKHQMRKYFYLGDLLDPSYKKKMYDGARLWTAQDPTRRPNPYTAAAKAKVRAAGKKVRFSWTPDFMNSWVDVRCTDNLRAMRETSVYLMAEETRNEQVRLKYKSIIRRYVWALWNIGMGEWDSENYHMHTFAPYLNLYDFAKDPEVKRLAKAALDILITMGAVKYYDGGFSGPIKRDYNKPYVFGGAAGELWLYFGDTPLANPHVHGDSIHIITSNYRPPAAVVDLARKRSGVPYEIFASKPTYENWKTEGEGYPAADYQDADHEPAFFETTYVGHTFQFGTLPQGSHGDVNGFKLLMRDSKKGAQFFVAASVEKPKDVNRGSGKDKIGQYRNVAINLTADGNAHWSFLVPAGATVETSRGVTFVRNKGTYIALHPVNLEIGRPDGKSPSRKWPNVQGMTAKGTGGAVSGFAMEVGEEPIHGSYDAFKRAVTSKANLKISGVHVSYKGSRGEGVALQLPPGKAAVVWRNGREVRYDKSRWPLYQGADGGASPVTLGWKEGKLVVSSGGKRFEAEFTRDGEYSWR